MLLLRIALVLSALASLVLAVGFVAEAPWATRLWPWEASPLSFLFLASIVAAVATPVLWIAVSGELAAMRAGAVDLGVVYAGMLVLTLTRLGDPGQPALGLPAAVFAVGLFAMVVTWVRARRTPWHDPRAMPRPVRVAFATLTAVLVGAGGALALGAEILPWPLGADTGPMFGFIYLGAAAYFAAGVLRPAWPNATGPLLGFLAYDLVLIGPFLDRFGDVSGGERLSLAVYTTVVVASGALATYYLFVHDDTRLRLT